MATFENKYNHIKEVLEYHSTDIICIPGRITDQEIELFTRRGIKVNREPLGYLRFERIKDKRKGYPLVLITIVR